MMGIPYLVEAAFGYCPKNAPVRRIITGVNWSVAIGDPFRELDEDVSLGELLAEQRAGPKEPIVFVLHVVCRRLPALRPRADDPGSGRARDRRDAGRCYRRPG